MDFYRKSHKIPEVMLFTSDQVQQRAEKEKLAYEESIINYTNKFISVNDTSSQLMIYTQQPCSK